MSILRRPIKDALTVPRDTFAEARMWRRIDAQLSGPASPPVRGRLAPAVALVLAVLAVCLWVVRPPAQHRAPGPLALAGGARLEAASAPAGPLVVTASDGSRLVLDQGASLTPLENTASSLVLRQAVGSISYDVTPGGPRHWSIECGLATVEVVGTSFTLTRAPHSLRVDVSRGVVLVRGERVPSGAQRLTAGASLVVTEPDPASALAPAPAPAPAPALAPALAPAPAPAPSPPPPWRSLADRGDHRTAYASLGAEGLARASAFAVSIDDLLALADVARLSGHPRDAVAPLERIVSGYRADPRSPLAAFTLGKMELDALADPARAADAFRTALQLGLRGGLREDAYVWLAEAEVLAGDRAAARATADEYRRAFPAGTRQPAIQRWLARP